MIQEREQESQKLLFGIASQALTKAIQQSGEPNGSDANEAVRDRLQLRAKSLTKMNKFDTILEKENERKNKRRRKGEGEQVVEKRKGVTRMCKSWKKLGVCP